MILIIDGGSIPYVLGWNLKDVTDEEIIVGSINSYMHDLTNRPGITSYCGFLDGGHCFRHSVAKHKPYKGNRGEEKPEWFERVGKFVIRELVEKWQFVVVDNIEADDACAIIAQHISEQRGPESYIVASADKDLKQIVGNHLYLRDMTEFSMVEFTSAYQWARLMLEGDTADNIAGIKGLGPKKVEALLLPATNSDDLRSIVGKAYLDYYGDYYGTIINIETDTLVSLASLSHCSKYGVDIDQIFREIHN